MTIYQYVVPKTKFFDMQQVPKVKFNKKDQPEFYQVLQKRVNNYFKENNISKYANINMKLKTLFMLCVYFIPLGLMISGTVTDKGLVLLLWIIMGFGMAGIGLSIMHDANHGSYFQNKKLSDFVGYIINFVGGYHINWKIQHNVLHHSFTNIEGYDEDIDKGVMRFSPTQERKPIFKYQIFYAPFLYGILTLYWFVGKDFEQLIRYNRKNLLATQGLTLRRALIEILLTKLGYLILTLIIPIMVLPQPWWQTLLGFLLMLFISGMILALIFQPAHVVEETDFYVPDENGSVQNSWAVHQLHTTTNFANDNALFSWLIGGLNFQIEHHLFPNICHVHYKPLSKIVKRTAEEYGLPYYHHETYYAALKSHFTMLNKLGTGEYDRELAKT